MSTRNLALRHTIRKATIKDCGLINRLAWKLFRRLTRPYWRRSRSSIWCTGCMTKPVCAARWRRKVMSILLFMWRRAGRLCVCASRRDAGVFHLEKIYVLPDFQGCHCGSALFRHAVAYVRRVCPEARAIELNVNRQNPALGFYRRMGMRIDREGDFDIGNGFYMNDYIMRLEL